MAAARFGRVLVTTSHSVLTLDLDSGARGLVHRGLGLYYGLARRRRGWLVAARGRMVSSAQPTEQERGTILVLDQRLRLVGRWQPPFALRDLHAIAYRRGWLWATCSRDDMVAIRSRWGRWRRWYPLGASSPPGVDRYHFNSLLFEPRRVWVLAHHWGESQLLAFSPQLAQRGLTHTPLARLPLGVQAHDLWREQGLLHTCSSATGEVLSEAGGRVPTGKFPRGVARLGHARSPGGSRGWALGLSELAERNERDLTTGEVVVYDAAWREQRRWRLPGEGLVLALAALD